MYIRYVDDIFAVFDKNTPFKPFFDHINSQHSNIKFTVEKSTNNCLPFLNTEIKLLGDSFESCVYRKATNTNVLLNVDAVCPMSWRKSLVFGAINRAKVICSSGESFYREIEKLKIIFFKNGYSNSFFNRIFESFEQRKVSDDVNSTKEEVDRRYILKIPYVGVVSNVFKTKLIKLFYDDLKVNIVPIFNTFKVSNYFSLKSQTPSILLSNVVYKFTCLCDTNISYIGKTKRHFITRCLEHLETDKKSEINIHIKRCKNCNLCNLDNFSILKKCKSDHEAKINEAICIKTEVPQLNKNLFNQGSFYTLRVYQ